MSESTDVRLLEFEEHYYEIFRDMKVCLNCTHYEHHGDFSFEGDCNMRGYEPDEYEVLAGLIAEGDHYQITVQHFYPACDMFVHRFAPEKEKP